MRVELHCHSTCSDGTASVESVATRAQGLTIFALTDHDTTSGSARAGGIRACELSCDLDGRTIHVLAYDRGTGWEALEAKLEGVRVSRGNRLRVMAAKLASRGVKVDVEPLVAEAARRSVGRPDLARMMVANGSASSFKDAFARHLYDGGPVDVPNRALPMAEAMIAAQEAGAALSLAHPHLYGDLGERILRDHPAITGVEAYYGGYDPSERARWLSLASSRGLTPTGGSDSHGEEALGVELSDEAAAQVTAWLTAPR